MRSPTGIWAFVASLVLLITIVNARHTCGCNSRPSSCYDSEIDVQGAISSGAQIVTYGEPCFCKESIPYSIEVPKPVPTSEERLQTYGYSVVTPASQTPGRCLQLPVKIQTPIEVQQPGDCLRGRSYGVTVQHQAQCRCSGHRSFDIAVQKPVHHVQCLDPKPSMSIAIDRIEEHYAPRFSPLPIAVQTPRLPDPVHERRLTGLSTTVDRVLVPACEIDNCPDCADVLSKQNIIKPTCSCY